MAGHECLNQNQVLNLCWESEMVCVDSKIPFLEMLKHYHKVEKSRILNQIDTPIVNYEYFKESSLILLSGSDCLYCGS